MKKQGWTEEIPWGAVLLPNRGIWLGIELYCQEVTPPKNQVKQRGNCLMKKHGWTDEIRWVAVISSDRGIRLAI
jgi:hypothetical protein